ncbi:hypothetical protein B0A49_02490 [Cryomyces minteri]|uniref:Uncharacterized protein n=1 Tax=Cryomyces minteri TaxID=331657 RepID=A0A4U0XQS8_9PEZI|nr:hypothetical protein B0A49_02490 [Cryomyces minteri]
MQLRPQSTLVLRQLGNFIYARGFFGSISPRGITIQNIDRTLGYRNEVVLLQFRREQRREEQRRRDGTIVEAAVGAAVQNLLPAIMQQQQQQQRQQQQLELPIHGGPPMRQAMLARESYNDGLGYVDTDSPYGRDGLRGPRSDYSYSDTRHEYREDSEQLNSRNNDSRDDGRRQQDRDNVGITVNIINDLSNYGGGGPRQAVSVTRGRVEDSGSDIRERDNGGNRPAMASPRDRVTEVDEFSSGEEDVRVPAYSRRAVPMPSRRGGEADSPPGYAEGTRQQQRRMSQSTTSYSSKSSRTVEYSDSSRASDHASQQCDNRGSANERSNDYNTMSRDVNANRSSIGKPEYVPQQRRLTAGRSNNDDPTDYTSEKRISRQAGGYNGYGNSTNDVARSSGRTSHENGNEALVPYDRGGSQQQSTSNRNNSSRAVVSHDRGDSYPSGRTGTSTSSGSVVSYNNNSSCQFGNSSSGKSVMPYDNGGSRSSLSNSNTGVVPYENRSSRQLGGSSRDGDSNAVARTRQQPDEYGYYSDSKRGYH